MQLSSHKSRAGITLVNVLVTISIIGVLAAILLPAIQAARSSARRADCLSRLRQIGLAEHNFESRMGYFASFTAPDQQDPQRRQHNLFVYLLEDLETTAIADQYSIEYDWFEALRPTPETANLRLADISIATLQCPSVSGTSGTGAADYAICAGMAAGTDSARAMLLSKQLITSRSSWQGMLAPFDDVTHRYYRVRSKDVGDGLRHTIMISESAGRPEYFVGRKQVHDSHIVPVSGAQWPDPEGEFSVDEFCNGALMNCHNNNEMYSFHAGGLNVVMGDGSAQFLDENLDPQVLVSLITRNAQD